jgi:eukaryotic-like serine/threonine-protein kinase
VHPGAVVAERFRILRPAGRGGMGAVYRATDLVLGASVAVKVLAYDAPDARDRFAREVRALASLAHPALVRYVAHGWLDDGRPFLAMEWLEGEDLAARLDRGPLRADEALALARRVAEALAVAHDAGVVHRDVKPGNLFLVGGQVKDVRVTDFGVASGNAVTTRLLTGTGVIVGTPGYMAPEQARGDGDVDGRADLFSLGCVLFECVTGRPPFDGPTVMAVLARLLLGEAPRMSSIAPGISPSLDELVARLLSRDVARRPPSARALATELDALCDGGGGFALSEAAPPLATEQRPVTVVLARMPADHVTAETLAVEDVERQRAVFTGLAERFGGAAIVLPDGAGIVAFQLDHVRDQVTRAARCALALAPHLPDAMLAIATTHVASRGDPAGSGVIQRVEPLLSGEPLVGPGVRLDDVTAGLLDATFAVTERDGATFLVGRSVTRAAARRVLGRVIPCVGRDKELRLLDAVLDECVDDSVARGVLVLGPSGIGKSRLRDEALDRFRSSSGARVLRVAADELAASTSLGVVRALLRAASAGSRDEVDAFETPLPPELQDLLAERLPDGGNAGLAAVADPGARRKRLQGLFQEWLATELSLGPRVVAIDDLQWADPLSVEWLLEALRAHAELPLLLFGLARPEGVELLSSLVETRNLAVVRLEPLSRRAAERLVKHVLGDGISAARASELVDRAAGHPLLLEELVRCVARAGESRVEIGGALVLLQSRFAKLPTDARQVLRVASVLGERVPLEALTVLLRRRLAESVVVPAIEALVRAEALEPLDPARGYIRFRHAMMREAAEALLTDEDRAALHLEAAEWHASRTETDPEIVARHFERAGEAGAAAPFWLEAAERAWATGDIAAAAALAQRGRVEGIDTSLDARLTMLLGTALSFSGRVDEGFALAGESLSRFEEGSETWIQFAAAGQYVAVQLGRHEVAALLGARVAASEFTPTPTVAWAQVGWCAVVAQLQLGEIDAARTIGHRFLAAPTDDRAAPSFVAVCAGLRALFAVLDDDAAAIRHARNAVEAGGGPEHRQLLAMTRAHLALHEADLLPGPIAERTLAATLDDVAATGTQLADDALIPAAAWLYAWGATDPERGMGDLAGLLDRATSGEAAVAVLLGRARAAGEVERREIAAELRGLLKAAAVAPLRALAHAVLAHVELLLGDYERALDHVGHAHALSLHCRSGLRTLVCASEIRALVAVGRDDEARAAAQSACARLDRLASEVPTESDRAALRDHPAARETWAVAAELGAVELS